MSSRTLVARLRRLSHGFSGQTCRYVIRTVVVHPMGASLPVIPQGDSAALSICPDRRMATELAELLDQEAPFLKAIDWKAYPDPRTLQELAANTALSLCFLDMETDREQGFRILAQHFALPGRLPVVVLLADKNPDLILRCLRQGAGGFLLRPFSADQLRLALARFLDRQSSPPDSATRRGEVYCVVPAKG